MALVIDPAGSELRALRRAATWQGAQVLEVGCGDGRLSRRLVQLGAARVDAIDPDPALVRAARRQLPPRFRDRVKFRVGHAERLAHASGKFDRVVFAWVL
jgi:2-polyprenyl-3-methyl-5-hydroxy-6-metoxy-1,4-benzoquinol methylase